MKKTIRKILGGKAMTYAMVIIVFVIMEALLHGGMISSSLAGQLVPICAYICMAIALNLTVGILGELSLGHAGFMSVGAFTGVVVVIALQGAVPSGTTSCRQSWTRKRSLGMFPNIASICASLMASWVPRAGRTSTSAPRSVRAW